MNKLGTILPTPKSMAINARYAAQTPIKLDKVLTDNQQIINQLTYRYVRGESRWYYSETVYCVPGIVGRRGLKWFEIKDDGWEYSTASPFAPKKQS